MGKERTLKIPIFFICKNYKHGHYLKSVFKQYRKYCPQADIYLISDNYDLQDISIKQYTIKDYFKTANEFENVYRHIAVNSYAFELFCFQRWFVLNEFLEFHKINCFFHSDVDNLIYCNIEDEWEKFKNYDYVLLKDGPYYYPHCSFWKSEVLKEFCGFMMDYYKNKEYEKTSNIPLYKGRRHFSDMSALKLFEAETADRVRLFDSGTTINNSVYNRSVHDVHIKWKNGIPYDKNTGVKYNNLHIIGGLSKHLIGRYIMFSKFPFTFHLYRIIKVLKNIVLRLIFACRKKI